MHTDSVTTTVPSQRSGVDRRKGPRRAEEAAVHYAILNVVAAAQGVREALSAGTLAPLSRQRIMELNRQLKQGETVPIVFTLEGKDGKRTQLEVKAQVRPLGGQ